MTDLSQLLNNLCADQKLLRDQARVELEKSLPNLPSKSINQLENETFSRLTQLENNDIDQLWDKSQNWAPVFGLLSSAAVLVDSGRSEDPFRKGLLGISLRHLSHHEWRVRTAAGKLLASLCKCDGVEAVYEPSKERLFALIDANFERRDEEDSVSVDSNSSSDSSAQRAFHDTAGWGSLETTMNCLKDIISVSGVTFRPYVHDSVLLSVLDRASSHRNRFVREASLQLVSSIVACLPTTGECETTSLIGRTIAAAISDNWSQVRLAGCTAARALLTHFKGTDAFETHLEALVPALCLNRYYLAEGVRIYSQQTWTLITDGRGADYVAKYIEPISDYYIEQAAADNHAVREAACHAIAELAAKVDHATVTAHVIRLLDTLKRCFEDESWPVRDAACLAAGRFLSAFNDRGEVSDRLKEFMPLFWIQVEDCIPSVRQGGAESLSTIYEAYPSQSFAFIWPNLLDGLGKVKEQSPNDNGSVGSQFVGASEFGVAKRIRDNDPNIHTDQQMYSCGSLAPKMGRGGGGGCGDHSFRRAATPWELTDGCVRLVAELSRFQPLRTQISKELLPKVLFACDKRDYVQHVALLETVMKCIPQLGRNYGKLPFKAHLQEFLQKIFVAAKCESNLTVVSAEEALTFLSHFYGRNIIRGRVEMLNGDVNAFLELYDQLMPEK